MHFLYFQCNKQQSVRVYLNNVTIWTTSNAVISFIFNMRRIFYYHSHSLHISYKSFLSSISKYECIEIKKFIELVIKRFW